MCNQARYAPVKSSQELSALIPKWESVSRDLQNFPGMRPSNAFVSSVRCALCSGMCRPASGDPSYVLSWFRPDSSAATVEPAFEAANKLYEEGRFSEAATAYEDNIGLRTAFRRRSISISGMLTLKPGNSGEPLRLTRKPDASTLETRISLPTCNLRETSGRGLPSASARFNDGWGNSV